MKAKPPNPPEPPAPLAGQEPLALEPPQPAGPAVKPPETKPPALKSSVIKRVPKKPPDSRDAAIESHFAKLLGAAPTPEQIHELYRIRLALDLDENDSLWLILLSLHYMRGQFEQSMDVRLEKAKDTADAIIESAKAEFLQKFPVERTRTAEPITGNALGFTGPVKIAAPGVLTGLMAGLALLIVGIGSVSWLAYDLGERSGYEKGVLAHKAATPPAPPPPAAPVKRR